MEILLSTYDKYLKLQNESVLESEGRPVYVTDLEFWSSKLIRKTLIPISYICHNVSISLTYLIGAQMYMSRNPPETVQQKLLPAQPLA